MVVEGMRPQPTSTLFPYTTLFRSEITGNDDDIAGLKCVGRNALAGQLAGTAPLDGPRLHGAALVFTFDRSEEHTSELQSRFDLVCRLLLEKKNRQSSLPSPPHSLH